MVNRERVREEPAHEVVLGKLLDIQARLRGEPASAMPATRPIAVDLPEVVTVVHGDMRILSDEPTDLAQARFASLQQRLAKLEAIIEEAGLLPEDDVDVTVDEVDVTEDDAGEATVTALQQPPQAADEDPAQD
jgi:hypothetical protein